MKVNQEDVDISWSEDDFRGPHQLDIRVKHRPTATVVKREGSQEASAELLLSAVLEMVDVVGQEPDPTPKSHLPGQGVTIGGRWVRQLCQWCGTAIVEHDLALVAVPVDQGPYEPPMWPLDRYVRSEGANPRVWSDAGAADPGSKSPADVCWLDNPEIAARRMADEAWEADEVAKQARIHATDNLLADCDVQTTTVDDRPHTMSVFHKPSGLNVQDRVYGGEQETRNALLSQLHGEIRQQEALLADCQVDVYTGAGKGVRIVHKPTGLMVSSAVDEGETERTTRNALLGKLRTMIRDHETQEWLDSGITGAEKVPNPSETPVARAAREKAEADWYARAEARAALLGVCTVELAPHPDGRPWCVVKHSASGLFEGAEVTGSELQTRDALLDRLLQRLDKRDAARTQEWSSADPPEDAGPPTGDDATEIRQAIVDTLRTPKSTTHFAGDGCPEQADPEGTS
jgi:hypothetical protein